MNRLDERSEASVAALLRCARGRFGRVGYDGVSLASLAAEAGLTKGAVYHHFGSKAALFEAVFRKEQRALVLRVAEGARGAANAADGLVLGVGVYFEAVLDPGLRRILLEDGPTVLGWEEWHRCEEPGFRGLLVAALRSLEREGKLRTGARPEDAAELLLGGLTGCALALAASNHPQEQAGRFRQAFEVHLGGLLTE